MAAVVGFDAVRRRCRTGGRTGALPALFSMFSLLTQRCQEGLLMSTPTHCPRRSRMLTNWIPKDSLAALNDGFVVAIMLEAKDGEADALADILRDMTPPTMAEPKVKLFLPYRSPTNPN